MMTKTMRLFVPLNVLIIISFADSFSISTTTTTTTATRGQLMTFLSQSTTTTTTTALFSSSSDAAQEQAKALLERARKMREEIASLEGKTLEDVEEEAKQKKEQEQQRQEELFKMEEENNNDKNNNNNNRRNNQPSYLTGRYLDVPVTGDDQITQAANAIEQAFEAGITRQIVRLGLIPEGEVFHDPSGDRNWPGGAQQMYREAAGPLTRQLLKEIRAPTKRRKSSKQTDNDDDSKDDQDKKHPSFSFMPPNVTSQDIWDFDGSALITAQAATGPQDDVQALVFPNTDNRYTRDIATISSVMKDRLFLLVNPFWRNLDSWGFNLLAPRAKEMAQEVIFSDSTFDNGSDSDGDGGSGSDGDGGRSPAFQETYVLLETSVRGEDCVALKAYPYDWHMYVYLEDDWGMERPIRLGTSETEPTTSDFAELLNEREEFKMSKNMRQMQRMMDNRNNNNNNKY